MTHNRRLAGGLGLIAIAIIGAGLLLSRPAQGQVVQKTVIATPVPLAPVPPKVDAGTPLAAQFSGVRLTENSSFRQYLNVARDCIKDKAWQDAVTALQTILDNKEDFYAQVTEVGPDGKKARRWTSVKFEANNLLGSMPEEGLDVYEQRFGAQAKNKLVEAKSTGSREVLAEVAQRFLHTKAGIEANDLLATYFMDRGQFFMAALRFEKLFAMNPERVKLEDLTLFKAALAYRRAGDTKNADATWRKLEPRLREHGGLKIGEDTIAETKLRGILDETPVTESASAFDWPYIRGNVSNSRRPREARRFSIWFSFSVRPSRIKTRTARTRRGRKPRSASIPRSRSKAATPTPRFCLASFRSLPTICWFIAATTTPGPFIFKMKRMPPARSSTRRAPSPGRAPISIGALANVLADSKTRVTLESWLSRFYGTPGFSSLVYENTLDGTLSTDHRNVYAVDDLAVPAPVDQFMQHIWNSGHVGQDVKTLVLQNTLYAFHLRQGNCLWRLGGGGGKDDPFTDSHFLGPPISVGGKLYALNEKNNGINGNGELRLVCIDPNKLAGPAPPR